MKKLPENSIFERRKKMDNHPILEITYLGFGINPCAMVAMAIRIITETNGDKTGINKKWLPKNFTNSAPKQEPQYVSFSASLPPCLCNGFPIYMISTTHTQRLQTRKHFQPKKKGSAQIPDSYFYPYKK